MSTTDPTEGAPMSGESSADDVAESNGSEDEIYGADHDIDIDGVTPDHTQPDKVREAERLREEREVEEDEQQETVEVPREQFDQLVATVDEMQDTIQQQQARIDELEHEVEETADDAAFAKRTALDLDRAVLGNYGESGLNNYLKNTDDDSLFDLLLTLKENSQSSTDVAELKERLRQEQIQRTQGDTKIQRLVKEVAEKQGVEIDELPVKSGDKISRLQHNGISDVVDARSITATHHRTEDLVKHIADWGSLKTIHGDTYYAVEWPEAKERLKLLRNEKLQYSQLKRVFNKIEDLTADSQRQAKRLERGDKPNLFGLQLTDEEVEAFSDGGGA